MSIKHDFEQNSSNYFMKSTWKCYYYFISRKRIEWDYLLYYHFEFVSAGRFSKTTLINIPF